MMKTNNITVDIEKERPHFSESFEHDDSEEDVLVPLKFDDGSQSQSKDGPRKALHRSNSGILSEGEISELSVGERSQDQDQNFAVNLSFPTGDSDEESEDSRNLIRDWDENDSQGSDVDSLSSGSNQKKIIPKDQLSSLLTKHDESENDDVENDLLLVQTDGRVQITVDSSDLHDDGRKDTKPMVELGVPDYIWKSPESLKKKPVKIGSSAASKDKKKMYAKLDEESLSDGSISDTESVLSAPQDQIQKQLFESDDVRTPEQPTTPVATDVRTPEQPLTPVEKLISPDLILAATPQQIGKKKLGKKAYLEEHQGDGKVSRYNPMFYSESKQAPLVDHSYRSKKEKLQVKKQRKQAIREERERLQAFYKTMDSFAATGLEGDTDEEKEGDKDGNEAPPPPSTPPATPAAASPSATPATTSSTEVETDTSTEESSYDSLMFDDDFSIASMDSIEGVTKVKKSSRKKKGKKATPGKKKVTKKKKVEKRRGRRADYEPDDDTGLEPERPPIPIDERVEAIFTNKELIYQLHPDVEKENPEEAHRKMKVKSKAASRKSGSRSRSRSVDRSRELARKFQQKRSTSSGALRSHKRRELAKRSMSSRSLKGSSLGDDEPFPTDSSGNAKSPGKNKFRFARPKPGGKQTRSNSFSAMATKMIDFDGDDGESDEKEEVLSFSEHVQRITRVKKTKSGDNLSKSDHGIGRKDGGKFISKSDHEVGTRPLLRGKRPDRVSKSPSNMRDSKRESKSKSPTAIPRKKIDLAKSESRSPSAMQRKKAEARNESMRKFEEILGKRDIDTTSPSIFKKKIDVNSPKRESKKLDPNESRGGSKSPSSMRRKKLEASESNKQKDPDEDTEEKPKSSRKKKSDLEELKKSKAPDPDDQQQQEHAVEKDVDEKPKSTRKKKLEPEELHQEDDPAEHHNDDDDDIEEDDLKPESTRGMEPEEGLVWEEEEEEEELKIEETTRRKAAREQPKRRRSLSRDFLSDVVESVKQFKPPKTKDISFVKSMKFSRSASKESSGGAGGD